MRKCLTPAVLATLLLTFPLVGPALADRQGIWAMSDGKVTVKVDDCGGNLCARIVDLKEPISKIDGKLAWARDLPEFKDGNRENRIVWTGPLLASGRLVVVSSEGDIVALSPQDGKTVADMKVGKSILIEPIAAAGKIFVVTDQANLIAIK